MVGNGPARYSALRCPSNGLAIRSASSKSITAPVDVIVVEEQTRLPLGRPWLSLAVDVPTRMVAGFHLSFDDPSALAVALVLTHAVLPKEAWLAERQISLPWPVSGLPDWIETDNGEEFHSKAFERGAAEYGIRLTYRPRGAPQVGGHIERLIGTFMHRIHLIPGTTFSNVADKGGYDSEGRAVMTLKELERWLALEILGVYHKSVHSRTPSTSGAGLERTDFRRARRRSATLKIQAVFFWTFFPPRNG